MPLRGIEGASQRLLGASREPLGVSLERPGGLPESLRGMLGARRPKIRPHGPSWNALGALLGLLWARVGLNEVVLEVPWAVLGPSWAVSGLSEAVLGPPWAPLGALWAL